MSIHVNRIIKTPLPANEGSILNQHLARIKYKYRLNTGEYFMTSAIGFRRITFIYDENGKFLYIDQGFRTRNVIIKDESEALSYDDIIRRYVPTGKYDKEEWKDIKIVSFVELYAEFCKLLK